MSLVIKAGIVGFIFVIMDLQFHILFRALDFSGKISQKEIGELFEKEYRKKFPFRLAIIAVSIALFTAMGISKEKYESIFITLFLISIFSWGLKAYFDCMASKRQATLPR